MTDTIHVWEKLDLTFTAEGSYTNPYTDVEAWVDLKGPGFARRVYGFWNGGNEFVVRVTATAPGTWTWTAASSTDDAGFAGKTGSFKATVWSEQELAENPNRRGMIRTAADGRRLEYADGTPYFLIGDTWWSLPSYRFPHKDGDTPKGLGPKTQRSPITPDIGAIRASTASA